MVIRKGTAQVTTTPETAATFGVFYRAIIEVVEKTEGNYTEVLTKAIVINSLDGVNFDSLNANETSYKVFANSTVNSAINQYKSDYFIDGAIEWIAPITEV